MCTCILSDKAPVKLRLFLFIFIRQIQPPASGMAKLLRMDYPVSGSWKEILASSFFVAATAYLFIIVFQPFGAYTYVHEYKNLMMLPYAVFAFIVYVAANFIIMERKGRWSLKKELLKNACVLLACSVPNYVYNIYFINHVSFSITHFFSMIFYTTAVASPITLSYMLGRYLYLGTQWDIPQQEHKGAPGRLLTITPDAGADALSLREEDFLFAESDGNYTTIHYLDGNFPGRQLLRLSLKNLETQVGAGTIMRCHRSYMVNTQRVSKMKGNAQGYKLFVENGTDFVPVSRNYVSKVKDRVSTV